jgi:hypothetical protein
MQKIHRIEIELLSQHRVGLQGLGIDLWQARERLNDGLPNLVASYSFSGA